MRATVSAAREAQCGFRAIRARNQVAAQILVRAHGIAQLLLRRLGHAHQRAAPAKVVPAEACDVIGLALPRVGRSCRSRL